MLSTDDFLEVLDKSDLMLVVMHPDGTSALVNQCLTEKLLGAFYPDRPESDYLGQSLENILPDVAIAQWLATLVEEIFQGQRDAIREEFVLQSGTVRFYLEVQAFPKHGPTGIEAVVILLKDLFYEKKLLKQLQQAEDVFTFKEVLLGASNELNNLMSILLSYSDLMGLRVGTDQKQADEMTKVNTQIQRARGIIADLLLLAKESGNLFGRVALNPIIQSVANMRKYELGVNNLQFELELEEVPDVAGDPHRLHQMILTLLNHCMAGIISSGRSGKISVRSYAQEHYVHIIFSDDGPPFDPDELSHIFDPFYKPTLSERKNNIGLNIARRIAREHSGDLIATPLESRGLQFMTIIPITEVSDLEPVEFNLFQAENQSLGSNGAATAKYKKIMIVDDEAGLREVLAELLQVMGFDPVACGDGRQALSMIVREKPDAIISDMRMPFVNGTTLYKAVKGMNPRLAANMLFITGDVVRTESTEFLKENNLPHLNKPFTLTQLVHALDFLAQTEDQRLATPAL